MKLPLLAAALALALSGCVSGSGGGFVAGDLATAQAVANTPSLPTTAAAPNAIDPAGYVCWGSLSTAAAALQGGQVVGLATMVEVARVAIMQVRKGGACGSLAAPLLSQMALLPGAGNAIALAATSVQ